MRVAWLSYFPVEWLPDAPEEVRALPKQHPATWQRVLIEELASEQGLDMHVLVVRKQFSRSFEFNWRGVKFHCLKVPGGMRSLSLFWWETILIKRALRKIRPDLVHAWGVERGAALVASRLDYPYLVTIQGLLRWYLQQIRESRAQAFEAALEKPSLRRASIVTTESSFGVDWLSREYPHLDIVQAEHAPNWLYHRLERHPETRPIRFLYVGMLSGIKGSDILLTGMERLMADVDFRLTIIGRGSPEFMSYVRSQTSEALWDRITIRQSLTPAQVAEEMQTATLMLFPTRADTSPNSVKEAVVAGLPVVASAVGGIPDYLKHGANGLLFAPKDGAAFTAAVRQALLHPLLGKGLVESETKERMRQYLSPSRMRLLFMGAYDKALAQKTRGA